jgi:hypothetical protein
LRIFNGSFLLIVRDGHPVLAEFLGGGTGTNRDRPDVLDPPCVAQGHTGQFGPVDLGQFDCVLNGRRSTRSTGHGTQYPFKHPDVPQHLRCHRSGTAIVT